MIQPLHVAPPGRDAAIVVGRSVIYPTSAAAPPREAEAVVRGEDTFLILNAAPVLRHPPGHPVRIFTDALEARPVRAGTVLHGEGRPLQMRAVIYDFDADDICQRDSIAQALDTVLRIVKARGIQILALPLLGTMHGYLPERSAAQILCEALLRSPEAAPPKVWLLVRAGSEATAAASLRAAASRAN